MSLIGAVFQEGIIIAYGGGRNGKSTYFNALGTVLGDYTGSIDIKVITTDRANKGASLATREGGDWSSPGSWRNTNGFPWRH